MGDGVAGYLKTIINEPLQLLVLKFLLAKKHAIRHIDILQHVKCAF